MKKVIDFIKEHNYLMILLIFIGFSISLSLTYSNFIVTSNNHKAAEMYIGELKYSIEIDGSTTNTLIVPTGETIIDVKVNNLNPVDTYYKLLYLKNTNITVKYYESTKDTNDVVTTYNKPNDSITSSNSNIVKLLITNSSTSSQNIAFTMKGGYITNTLNDIVVPSTHNEITPLENSTNTYFCKTNNTLTQGLQYVNGQYTYAYKQGGQKANSGLDVRVLYDDMGSFAMLPSNYPKLLGKYGIKCMQFNKLSPFAGIIMNNRDHRKMMIIDGHTAFSGGINISDEYININSKLGVWKDNGIRIKGEAVWNFTVMFLEMWNSFKKEDNDYNKYKYNFTEKYKENGFVVPYGESPLDDVITGEDIYLNIINQAKKYVYIYTPYLIIDTDMINSLILAARRGVDVRIVVPGIPDKKIVYDLTSSYFYTLIKGGVKIYTYTNGFVHSKVFLSDDEIATVGTINLDYRSLYLHFECGIYMKDTNVIKDIKKDFEDSFKESHKVDEKEAKNGLFKGLWQAILRLFAPMM